MHFTREHRGTEFVSDKISGGMFLFLAVLSLVTPVLVLTILDRVKPALKYRWLGVLGGVITAFIFILLWQLNIPARISLSVWQVGLLPQVQPAMLLDSVSWSYSLSLVSLVAAIILTTGIRQETASRSWVFTLLLTTLGILAVSASDPLTLILMWTAMDVFVLGFMVFLNPGRELGRPMITSFSFRLLGTGIFLLAGIMGADAFLPVGFERISSGPTLLAILAAALRLGIFPLGLLFPEESSTRRGMFTAFRLVFPTTGFAFLARLPGFGLSNAPELLAFCILVILAFWAGWKWVKSSNEIAGRPYWIAGIFTLVTLSSFVAEPALSPGLGVMLVLSGAFLFLLSSQEKNILWSAGVCLWGLTAMPFSPAAGIWILRDGFSWLLLLVILPSQALLVSGFIHHLGRPGDRLPVSRERWHQIPYVIGIVFLCLIIILLGLWGWVGAARLGTWWASIIVVGLAVLFLLLGSRIKVKPQSGFFLRQERATRLVMNKVGETTVAWVEKALHAISSTLEGEGGIIWSILILVLILSLLTLGGQ